MQLIVHEASRLSQVTTSEYIEIKASLHVLDNDQFQCGKCQSQRPELIDKLKQVKGCTTDSPTPIHSIGDKREIRFTRCIGNYFSHVILDLLELHRLYELGVMPGPGSPLDQCAHTIESFNVISQWKQDKLRKELKKERAKTQARVRGRLGK